MISALIYLFLVSIPLLFGSAPFNRPGLFSYEWPMNTVSLGYVGLGKLAWLEVFEWCVNSCSDRFHQCSCNCCYSTRQDLCLFKEKEWRSRSAGVSGQCNYWLSFVRSSCWWCLSARHDANGDDSYAYRSTDFWVSPQSLYDILEVWVLIIWSDGQQEPRRIG